MDRDLSPSERRAHLARRGLPALAIALAAIFAIAALPRLLTPALTRDSVRLSRVERGDVTAVVEATGTVEPAAERLVTSPLDARVLRVLRQPGDAVRAGDPLLELDVSAARVELARLQDRIATLQLDLEQAGLAQQREADDLRSREESRRLEREVARARLQRSEKLRAEGLVSDEQIDERRLELQRADIDVAHLAQARESESLVSRSRLQGLRLQLQQAERERGEQARLLDLASTRSEEDGVVTWIVDDPGAALRRGDPVARLARLDAYVVKASVSDVHASRVRPGLPVRVRAPGLEIGGRIASVNPAVERGTLTFVVSLDDPASSGLRPSLRVDAWVVAEERTGVPFVARAAGTQGNSRATLFVVQGQAAIRRAVRFGLAGPDRIEVLEGLAEGDEVIVSDTSTVGSAERVRLR